MTVLWGSMYGNTEIAVSAALTALKGTGLAIYEHRIPGAHIGDILASVWRSTGIILAMPTYEYKMFPPMAEILDELGRKKVRNRHAFRFGSYGWSGGAQTELDAIMERHQTGWRFVAPVEFKGRPGASDLAAIRAQTTNLASIVASVL